MTNLIGSIGLVVVTNWTTVYVDKPQCHAVACKKVHKETHYQLGTVVTNTVINMDWMGQKRELVLESSQPYSVTRVGTVDVGFPPGVILQTNSSHKMTTDSPPLLISKPKK